MKACQLCGAQFSDDVLVVACAKDPGASCAPQRVVGPISWEFSERYQGVVDARARRKDVRKEVAATA